MSGGDESSARRKKTERRPTKKDKRTQGQRTGSSDEAVRGARSKTENVPSRWKEEEMVVVGEGREKEKEKERERKREGINGINTKRPRGDRRSATAGASRGGGGGGGGI